jgi:succinyl-CoA synthetase beta subunit
MDLLEYQGKQLFRRHGVPIPDGEPARSVGEVADTAEELGFPVVIKAQVQIGGRGKAGGIKLAKDREDATLVEVSPQLVTEEREVIALDAKVTIDGNALFRHPDVAELRDLSAEDPQERVVELAA